MSDIVFTPADMKGSSFERLDIEQLRKKVTEMESKLGNSDGKLDRVELGLILVASGVSKQVAGNYVNDFFRFADRKRTGEVDLELFISEYVRMGQFRAFHALRTRYGIIDSNHDGKVAISELTKELEAYMGKARAAEEVKSMDADASGTISLVELEAWYNKNKENLRKAWAHQLDGPPAEKPSITETLEGGTLMIWIDSAEDLVFTKKQDLYVKITTDNKSQKTKVITTDKKNVEWKEGPFKFTLAKDAALHLAIYDKDTFSSDDVISRCMLEVKDVAFGTGNDRKVDLVDMKGGEAGKLNFRRKFISVEKAKLLETFFKKVDKDGSKTVDLAELELWLDTLAKASDMISKMDKDANNSVTQEEFTLYMSQFSMEQLHIVIDHWQRVSETRRKKKEAGAPAKKAP